MASNLARGPLNTLLANAPAQWAVIGAGVYTFINPDVLQQAIQSLQQTNLVDSQRLADAAAHATASPSQIIIRTDNGSCSEGKSVMWTVTSCVGYAGAVWVTYTVFTSVLPDALGGCMPVTKKALEDTQSKLAGTVVSVRDALHAQILKVMDKQEDLEQKQDDTLHELKHAQTQLQRVRSDMVAIKQSAFRTESALHDQHGLQDYTARGVKLLVTAVSSMLEGDNRISKELVDYQKAGDMIYNKSPEEAELPALPPPMTPEDEHPDRENSFRSIMELTKENMFSDIERDVARFGGPVVSRA